MHAHPRSIYLNCGGSARDTATELYSTASFVSDAAAALAPPQQHTAAALIHALCLRLPPKAEKRIVLSHVLHSLWLFGHGNSVSNTRPAFATASK